MVKNRQIGTEEKIASPKKDNILENINNDKKFLEHASKLIKNFLYGEPTNQKLVIEAPEVEMRLYGIKDTYFDTREELEKDCISRGITLDDSYILDYIRAFANRFDIIRKVEKNGNATYFTAIDEDGYAIYHQERSIYQGRFVWEFSYGSINELYIPFRDRGIQFENDIYAKELEMKSEYQKIHKPFFPFRNSNNE